MPPVLYGSTKANHFSIYSASQMSFVACAELCAALLVVSEITRLGRSMQTVVTGVTAMQI